MQRKKWLQINSTLYTGGVKSIPQFNFNLISASATSSSSSTTTASPNYFISSALRATTRGNKLKLHPVLNVLFSTLSPPTVTDGLIRIFFVQIAASFVSETIFVFLTSCMKHLLTYLLTPPFWVLFCSVLTRRVILFKSGVIRFVSLLYSLTVSLLNEL